MVSYSTDVRWPTRDDYDLAMEDLPKNILDVELRRGRIATTNTGIMIRFGSPDALICLYQIDNWMIRCFCRTEDREPDESITERSQQLSKFYLDNHTRVSALVPIDYLEKGIKVGFYERDTLNTSVGFIKEGIVPIVKMPFVTGLSLGTFIAANRENSQRMYQLSAAWLRMIREMEAVHIAHGNLDLTHVLVQEGATRGELLLKLIDYDNTWIPGFERYPLSEYGHKSFQHPSFFSKSSTFNVEIDRFAALVIYISLRLLAAFPQYYSTWQMSEYRLLFTPNDYKAEQQSKSGRISQLRALNIPGLDLYINELSASLREGRLPRSLDSIVPLFKINAALTEEIPGNKKSEQAPQADSSGSASPFPHVKLVICYAREDEDLLKKLKAHLRPLERKKLIEIWYDRDINAGTPWQRAIDEHLKTAHIILLLVSPDFIDSDYCYGTEMVRALERHERGEAVVIPVILHHTDWQDTPLGMLQALPRDATPIIDRNWYSIHEALYDVVKGIKDVINQLKIPSSPTPPTVSATTTKGGQSTAPSQNLEGTPDRPRTTTAKDERPATPGLYKQQLSQQYPGLFVILLDQSVSMMERESKSGASKADIVTSYVNSIIRNMLEYAQVDEFSGRRKNYAYVSILGYNDDVYPLHSGDIAPVSLPDLDDTEKGYLNEDKILRNQDGTIRRIKGRVKFWIEPEAKGNTDMAQAFEEAEKVIRIWLQSKPEYVSQDIGMQMPRSKSFPPVLINITDVKHNGKQDPEEVIERIRQMGTEDGNVLIFNCYYSNDSGQPAIAFPSDVAKLRHLTRSNQAEKMFYMSSEIPETLRRKAEYVMQMPILPGSRCFVYNTNPDKLLKFLNWPK
jgi:TIR domain